MIDTDDTTPDTTKSEDTTATARRPASAASGQRPETPPTLLATIALVAATAISGLFAGFFLAYSMSVELGLAAVDDITYVNTFQAINDTIRNPAFAVVFFGAVPTIAIAALLHRGGSRRGLTALLVGGALSAAVVAITFAANVPLNDQLASYTDPSAATARIARDEFESTWNRWNLARTVLAVAGTIAVTAAWPLRRSDAA